jgi:hypothetical protein
MIALDLPVHLATKWDRFQNPIGFIGVREATGTQLEAAASLNAIGMWP